MTKTEIVTIIRKVLSRTEDVVAQLRAEKKRTGDYSKSVMVKDGDLEIQYNAMEFQGKFPPISVNLLFSVIVFCNETSLMKCRVGNIKHRFDFSFNLGDCYTCSENYKVCALVCGPCENDTTYSKMVEVSFENYHWLEYDKEDAAKPAPTEAEILQQLKQKALDKLLENCRAEFCYGDPRVEKYKKYYMILGEDVIDSIHEKYLTWLKENCSTFVQEAASGEFSGIAIDWHGKDDQQPKFDEAVLSDL